MSEDQSPATQSPLRLLLVDDHAVMRSGLANMLNSREEFTVVAEAGNGRDAVELCQQHQPDLTLMDVVMPDIGGVESLRAIKANSPDASVLMLSSSVPVSEIGHNCLVSNLKKGLCPVSQTILSSLGAKTISKSESSCRR